MGLAVTYIHYLFLDDFIVLSAQDTHRRNKSNSIPSATNKLVYDDFRHDVLDIVFWLGLVLILPFLFGFLFPFGWLRLLGSGKSLLKGLKPEKRQR
jgi:hypothetical protein